MVRLSSMALYISGGSGQVSAGRWNHNWKRPSRVFHVVWTTTVTSLGWNHEALVRARRVIWRTP